MLHFVSLLQSKRNFLVLMSIKLFYINKYKPNKYTQQSLLTMQHVSLLTLGCTVYSTSIQNLYLGDHSVVCNSNMHPLWIVVFPSWVQIPYYCYPPTTHLIKKCHIATKLASSCGKVHEA